MENRTFIEGTYFSGKDCKWVRRCSFKNAEVKADSFVDINTICLTKAGEIRFEENQIKFAVWKQDAFQNTEKS